MLITQSTPSTSFTDDEIVSLLLEGNRAPLVTGEYQLPPKDLYLDASDIKKFSAKPKELETLWRRFQRQYFGQADELDNKNLLEFCHLIIHEFNERNQANNDNNLALPKEPIIEISPDNTNDLQALSQLINKNISQEQQELFWRDQILFIKPKLAKK